MHSKVLVIDDVLLRVGSSNLNNRSMGFDSECDVAIEAAHDSSAGEDVRTVVRSVRRGLVCEHLGVTVDEFEQRVREGASFLRAIEDLRGEGRTLRPFTEDIVAGEASPLAENELMDPDRVPRSLTSALRRLITGLTR